MKHAQARYIGKVGHRDIPEEMVFDMGEDALQADVVEPLPGDGLPRDRRVRMRLQKPRREEQRCRRDPACARRNSDSSSPDRTDKPICSITLSEVTAQ